MAQLGVTRQRRQRKQIETLESDNFQDQPHLLFDEAPTAAALAAKVALADDDGECFKLLASEIGINELSNNQKQAPVKPSVL